MPRSDLTHDARQSVEVTRLSRIDLDVDRLEVLVRAAKGALHAIPLYLSDLQAASNQVTELSKLLGVGYRV